MMARLFGGRVSFSFVGLLLVAAVLAASPGAVASPWPVSTVFEEASGGWVDPPGRFANTTSLRALELSSDASSIYSGWLHGPQVVWRHDATTGAVTATYDMGGVQANAIATDDRGYVYIGEGDYGGGQIRIAPSGLTGTVKSFGGKADTEVEGLSVRKELPAGGDLPNYYLYVTRNDGTIERYDVTDPNNPGLDPSFGSGGVYSGLAGQPLRGIEVAADGTMFVAQRDSAPGTSDRLGFVYAIPPTLPTDPFLSYSEIPAMDLALYGDTLYVTTYNGDGSMVYVFDVSGGGLAFSDVLEPFVTDGPARQDVYGYAGIDVSPVDGRVFFNDQWYSISGENLDRILTNPPRETFQQPIPEPASLVLVGAGLLALARRRRRRR